MISQLKARREAAPAPKVTGKEDYSPPTKTENDLDAEQQADARLTCDALCSLARGSSAATSGKSADAAVAVTPAIPGMSGLAASQSLGVHGFRYRSTAIAAPAQGTPSTTSTAKSFREKTRRCSPKQHQLPLFLSKTYHMIDKCDPEIATWSTTGDNFVVKNVEKFASAVLPLYFKHSNFSSFARQLNFYGFRKLRSDPILTNDVDPKTACYVRFYHEKFQKNKPELLHGIKRATKSDQQSKDDVDDLKSQVVTLKKCVVDMSARMERKISELNFDYNNRINDLSAEYEKLSNLVGKIFQHQPYASQNPALSHVGQHPHYISNSSLPPVVETTTTMPITNTLISTSGNTTTTSSSSLSSTTTITTSAQSSTGAPVPVEQQHKMQSLSQVAAMSLMAKAAIPIAASGSTGQVSSTSQRVTAIPSLAAFGTKSASKRTAPESVASSESQQPVATRPKSR